MVDLELARGVIACMALTNSLVATMELKCTMEGKYLELTSTPPLRKEWFSIINRGGLGSIKHCSKLKAGARAGMSFSHNKKLKQHLLSAGK